MYIVIIIINLCLFTLSLPHRYGLDSIPVSWLDKYPRLDEVVGYIETVVKL